MSAIEAHAKINLALVVGPLREDGKHEVVTVFQQIGLADRLELERATTLTVDGFPDDTIVRAALTALAERAGVEPLWRVAIEKRIPVAAGLGGGSSDGAAALLLANAELPRPLPLGELHRIAGGIGADVPFFLLGGLQLATGDGTELRPVGLPLGYHVLLVLPDGEAKASTGAVYQAFDERDGARGFAERKAALMSALARVEEPRDLARLPRNDLASSPLSARLEDLGAFRADVSGAGPAVYALFDDERLAERARDEVASFGDTWLTRPISAAPVGGGGKMPRGSGAWPSGKATGFGPVIPGSNPGAPASMSGNAEPTLGAVVMAAGLGTRMRSAVPKHLHPILGKRMVDWVLEAAAGVGASRLVVVASPGSAAAFDGVEVAVQLEPLGTGDAVRTARSALEGRAEDVLVLSGDTPLLTSELLRELVETHRREEAWATVLSFEPEDPKHYGRVLRNPEGGLDAIVEYRDATPEQREVREVNSSIYVFRGERLWPVLERLTSHNEQGELYLTDSIALLVGEGGRVAVHKGGDPVETEGVNTRVELAAAGAALRDRILEQHMLAGVTIVDPATTWIEAETTIEPDAVIHPFTVIRGASRIAAGAEVGPHAVLVDSAVGERALVGPFCYLRPGTVLEAGAKAGTFVEMKNSHIGERTKVPHLSYLGDADVGPDSNIAAGNITVNLDHATRRKERTVIGRNVRTGVDNAFVAPVTIGDDAWIAAGSVITEDVPAGALAIARARQVNKEGRGGERND
jgi:bifunctional UDP-N-acetylglucosamine pyrophosphorylase/glucosamine-1-phosphate N-acetyltransferase